MQKVSFLLLLTLSVIISKVHATTWDEPWAEKVIKESSSFVLAKVISSDPEKGINIEIIKTIGGSPLSGKIDITNFYLLHLCSRSGNEGPEFHLAKTDSCYFFIKQNSKGEYCIATPTTGFEPSSEGHVVATYRHSYHQAWVPAEIYEKTMTAIFNYYHGISFDRDYVTTLANKYLALKPAGFSKEEAPTFFLQHVALECIYHLKLTISDSLIIPFLNDKSNFHNQVSAARALRAINTNNSKKAIVKIIADKDQKSFVQVLCVQTLQSLDVKELKPQLTDLIKTASEENNDFGGNIMDPRVCTSLPSVKQALQELVEKL